jgi:ribosomal protein S18 acetylase RimI-like enzyme
VVDLRTLTSDDWSVWRELRLAALAEAPYAFGARLSDWQGAGDRVDRWRARLELPGSYNLVAVHDATPAGMVTGRPTPDPGVAELISMWVAPFARGRGVGDRLVRAVLAWAHDRGAHRVELAVAEGNDRAASLYRRHGFVDTGEMGDLMPDGVHREAIMARELSPGAPSD